ncbi:PREDICTED: cytokine receptor common subunit beta [Condylura cristata]|uniref:cytokine receptor common subunit beta n=1 Tax=Condylura cristata TaxID=143302 RepID=UPI0003344A30|nr:PREDICTED: cytokine receptor common subunit beta [Condylura cristata]
MALTQGLLPIALLALCWGSSIARHQGTIPLRTLQCLNDYTSRIVCRWADPLAMWGLLNLTLHRSLSRAPPQPVSCEISDDKSWLDGLCLNCVPRRCIIPYKPFVLSDKDYFSFRVDRPLSAEISVPLSQHVQPPAPTDLRVSASGAQVLLSWSVALGPAHSRWLPALDFEVVFRRLQDSWEEAVTVHSSSQQATLGPPHLLPSTTYLARVRSRLGPDSGLSGWPSLWSPEVRWDSLPGDEAQPQNLRCFFNGVDALSCSWEVRNEVTRSVSFSLFYKSSPDEGERECSPVQKEVLQKAPDYTLHRCKVPVPDPHNCSHYTVSVRPRDEGKLIKSSDNIQLEPPTINVTQGADGYILHWAAKKMPYDHIGHTFEVQYRTDAASWEDTKADLLQNAHSMSLPHLESSTRYWARVRVKPTPSDYNGVWSEWSDDCFWDTEWELPTWVLPLFLVFITLALLPALRFCHTYCYRLNQKWEEKIPNPSKSHLFQNGSSGLWRPNNLPTPGHGCPPLKGPWDSLTMEPQGVFSVDSGHIKVSLLTTQDPKDAADSPWEPDAGPAAADPAPAPEPPPSPSPGQSAPSSRPKGQASGFDFDGPYLGSPHRHPLPDTEGTLLPPQAGLSPRPQPPQGTLQYMCLPPGEQARLVPLAQVMGQGQTPAADSRPCAGTEGGPSLQPGTDPPASAPGSTPGLADPKDGPPAVPAGSGHPEDSVRVSGYVSPADLALSLPTGTSSTLQAPPLGLPSERHPSLNPAPASTPSGGPAPVKPELEGYVQLPPPAGQLPMSPQASPTPPVATGPDLSPGPPSADVNPTSPHSEGLLVLQQVGDYCFLPGLAHSPVSLKSKPSSPDPCPEARDQVSLNKKNWCPATPQLPAIQLFKALKQQDYLSLPPWDGSRRGEVC